MKSFLTLLVFLIYLNSTSTNEGIIRVPLNKSKEHTPSQLATRIFNLQKNVLSQKEDLLFQNSSRNEQNITFEDRGIVELKQSVSLINYLNVQYYGILEVGAKGQDFNVLFDTGSNQLWLPSTFCAACQASSKYSCIPSKCSFETQEIIYGQGYVKGNVSQDLIILADRKTIFPFLSIFEAKDLEGFKADGILGMGVNKKESIIHKLFSEKKIEQDLFAFRLSTNEEKSQVSELIIGGYDEKLIEGKQLHYYPVISKYYWAIKLKASSLGSTNLFPKKYDFKIALIDSGTSLIHMPSSDFKLFNQTVYDKLKLCFNYGIVICSCQLSVLQTFPPLIVKFEDETFELREIEILPKYFILFESEYCYFLVQELPSFGIDNLWILGDVFMRQTYNIFNYDKNAIGIVNLDKALNGEIPISNEYSTFTKICLLLVILVLIAFLAKFIYDNYINKSSSIQPSYYYSQDFPLQNIQPLITIREDHPLQ